MVLTHVFHVLRAWQRYRACVRELSKLTDLELADIGISRSGIISVAWQTALTHMAARKDPDGRLDGT
jgi:uncharacterized protein YjiS (DUF1127 family)